MRDKKKIISNIQTRMQGMSQGSPEYANAQARLERVQARPTIDVRQANQSALRPPMQPAMRPQLPPQAAPQAQANISQPMPRPLPLQAQGQPQGAPIQQVGQTIQPEMQVPQFNGDLGAMRQQYGQAMNQPQRPDLQPQVTDQVFAQLGAKQPMPQKSALQGIQTAQSKTMFRG